MTSIEHHIEDNHRRRYAPARQYEVPERQVLHESIARLRAFAILLCMDVNLGEELVKVTLLRASAAIDPGGLGTNLATWLIRRLRSYYYREYARRPAVMPPGGASVERSDILATLAKLRAEQREALILVEAIRLSFGEAARICGQPPGRFRNLVEGARADLASHLERQRREGPKHDRVSLGLVLTSGKIVLKVA
jgi:RNA polymerase sigma-70 factor (ECF subfamily)